MKIKVVNGGSGDSRVLYFSYWTLFGLGHERIVALYYPSTNTLLVVNGCQSFLDKILNALKRHSVPEDKPHKPIKVEYWVD